MIDRRTRQLFRSMLREEWRLHSALFHGSRFALFPVVVCLFAAGATALLVATGTAPATVVMGLHALVFVFGLHTGSIGLVGQDRLRDRIGDVSLLLFAARTLPVARSHLLGVFVVKDVVYYAVLFVLPLTVGPVVAIAGLGQLSGPVHGLGTGALLWLTLTLTFVLGLATTIAGIGLLRRRLAGLAVLGGLAIGIAGVLATGIHLPSLTPYGLFREPTLTTLALSLGVVLGTLGLAARVYDPSARRPARTADPAFRRWLSRVGDPLATKTLLDVHRSAGGFGKVCFSGAVLLGVTAALVDLASGITGLSPAIGTSYGAILGLSGFTTYNWLTQADDVDANRIHPVGVEQLVAAKFRAFLLLGPVVGLAFYAVPVGVLGTTITDAVVGALLLVGVACYIFGTTVYLAGLSPNEFLFDALLFAAFGIALIVPLVPILIVGFALAPVSGLLAVLLGVTGVALGVGGVGLYRLARPRWARRYRI